MQDPNHLKFWYPGTVKVLRDAIQRLLEEHDWRWESSSDERLYLYEYRYRSLVGMTVWRVHAPRIEDERRVAIIRAREFPKERTVVELLDGEDVGGNGQPIGDSLVELASEILRRLADELDRKKVSQGVAVVEEPNGEQRVISEPELLERLHDRDRMKRYFRDYAPTTAIKIIREMPRAEDEALRKHQRWGPGVFAHDLKLSATTIGRYFRAMWMAGLREIYGVEIPYSGRSGKT